MANYRISNEAKDDLIHIYRYGVIRFGEAQAEKYFSELYDQFESIAFHPDHYQALEHIKPGYRRCPYKSDNIYFRFENDVVEIMAIVGRQDIGSKL